MAAPSPAAPPPRARRRAAPIAALALAALAALAGLASCMPPSWGAAAVLHPRRRPVTQVPPYPREDLTFAGEGGVTLKGWRFRTDQPRRGVIVYLHGIADNRQSSWGLVSRFRPQGYDVVAFDARAHGESTGDACTYGYHEKQDLRRVLDALGEPRVVLFGVSLGAAVALQEAADDPRVAGVVSVSTFADLRTVARERAPVIASAAQIQEALALAGKEGRFDVDEASVVKAAPRVRVPVLVLHGAADRETLPAHSRRVHDALGGPKRLVLVPGAGHADVLREATWSTISDWLLAL
jgi:pimeloyl-ACP methyl ester carboxylesterase